MGYIGKPPTRRYNLSMLEPVYAVFRFNAIAGRMPYTLKLSGCGLLILWRPYSNRQHEGGTSGQMPSILLDGRRFRDHTERCDRRTRVLITQ